MAADAQLDQQARARLQRIDQLYTRGRQAIVDALVEAGTPGDPSRATGTGPRPPPRVPPTATCR